MVTRLHPSFLRVAIKVGLVIIFVSVVGYVLQGYNEGKWWTSGYMLSLLVPILISPVIVWFMFVPRLIEFSDAEITLSTLLGTCTYPWENLDCYGPGNNVFRIQFSGDQQPYQIFAGAYSKEEWNKLIDLLNARFPDRVMAYSVGVRMFQKKDK